ncbi:MAG: hypothetical protein ABJD11_14580, partial [Gemmatimonadota bacterium]
MVTFLKGRRNGATDAVAPVDSHSARATAALESLVMRAEAAADQLRAFAPILERAEELDTLRESCVAVEQQVAGLEGLGAQLRAAEEKAEQLSKAQARSEAQVSHSSEDLDRIRSQMATLLDKADNALLLRGQLETFLSNESPVAALRADADAIRAQLTDLGENVARVRGQADDALRAHRHTTSRLEAFDQDHQAATGRLEEVERRLQAVGRSLEPVDQAMAAVPDLQHRLAVLKSLADQLSQKTTMLEQQREAVDRAANQISQLTRLDRELDSWLRRQEEQIRRFTGIETKLNEVQAVQAKVITRSEELQAASERAEEAQQAARQSIVELREQMRKSSESFELENRGLHSVSERVADLRNAVKECEARFAVLDAASQGVASVQAQVRTVVDEAASLNEQVSRLTVQAAEASTLGASLEKLSGTAGDVAQRVQRIEELRPGVEEVVRHAATLHGTREMLADGLEQMSLAYTEMNRLREAHAETEAWLTNADVWCRKVQSQVKELSAMEPAVERIRTEVDDVKNSMVEIHARRTLVDEVHTRLAELGSLSGELRERTDGLRTRMDAAESRFAQLGKQADEANDVSSTIAGVTTAVIDAEQRLNGVGTSVRALESRAQQLDEFGERVRLLGQELQQRQGALDKATEHLTQASALRQQTAETAQYLEEVTRGVNSSLGQAEERAAGLQRVSGDLENRATALRAVDRQLGRFEDLLGKWESAQADAARALEQTVARQAAMDALETQVKHVFTLAERAVEDVRVIGAS